MPKKTQMLDPNSSRSVAENNYHPSHNKGDTELEKGLAQTHEQVFDQFTEGTIDQIIDK